MFNFENWLFSIVDSLQKALAHFYPAGKQELTELNTFKLRKTTISSTLLNFKGTVVNHALPFMHWGSLKIMLTVLLNVKLFCVLLKTFLLDFSFLILKCVLSVKIRISTIGWNEKLLTGIKRYLMAKIPLKVISEVYASFVLQWAQ